MSESTNHTSPTLVNTLPEGPYLVFATHPGDESLGLGGTLTLASQAGISIAIVFLGDCHEADCQQAARLAAEKLGVEKCWFWQLADSAIQPEQALYDRVVTVIQSWQPATIFAPYPVETQQTAYSITTALVIASIEPLNYQGTVWFYELQQQTETQQAQTAFSGLPVKALIPRTRTNQLFAQAYTEALQTLVRLHSPLISVIVRTQNRPHLLAKALQSIAAQTYAPIEAVVVNDGGCDVTAIVTRFKSVNNLSVQLIQHSEVRERSVAANTGLQAAQGTWIAFLDDDDVLVPDGLENIARFIDWDKNVIYGRVQVLQMAADQNNIRQTGMFGEPFNADRLLLGNYIPICSFICKRELALSIGGFDKAFICLEDWDFLFRLSRKTNFHYTPDLVANYCVWGESHVSGKNEERENYYRTLFFEKHHEACSPEALRRASLALTAASNARFDDLMTQHQAQISALKKVHVDETHVLKGEHEKEIYQLQVQLQADHEEHFQQLHTEYEQRLTQQQQQHEQETTTLRTEHAEHIKKRQADHEEHFQQQHTEYEQRLTQQQQQHEQETTTLRTEHAEQIKKRQADHEEHLQQQHEQETSKLRTEYEQHLKESAYRIKALEEDLTWEHNLWQAYMLDLTREVTSALPFETEETPLVLEKYRLAPLLRIYSGEETTTHEVIISFADIDNPLIIFKKSIQWTLNWAGEHAAHVFSLKLGTYNRENHCHLHLSIFSLTESDEIYAKAVVNGVAAKDNSYNAFLLDKPLPAGKYLCVIDSPDADHENALAVYVTPRQNIQLAATREDSDAIPRLTLPDSETYHKWYELNRCNKYQLEAQRRQLQEWQAPPLISVIIPTFNSHPEWLEELLSSLHEQTYPHWECIIVDDASPTTAHLEVARQWCKQDARFHLVQHLENQGVSSASQTGVEAAEGLYLCVVDHDDRLEPQALFEIALVILQKQPDVIYSDEMLVDENGQMIRCEFRPDFDYHFLLSHPYIIHLTLFRREVVLKAGGFAENLQVSQDYDLLLRVAATTQDFYHLPKVLYQWRTYSRSTGHSQAEKVMSNSLAAINQHLRMKGFDETEAWAAEGQAFNFFRVRHKISPTKVSIIIPTRDRVDLLKTCIESINRKTRIPKGVELEFVIVDNDSTCTDTLAYFEELQAMGVLIVKQSGAFNFSLLNNKAVKQATGSMLLFLNNDIEIVEAEWLEAMLELMAWNDVGIVGAKLVYPDIGTIQHAGVLIGFNGAAAHDHQFYPEYDELGNLTPGHNHALLVIRECMAVTAACMLVRSEAFDAVNGFDEQLQVGFGDTDLCLKIREKGYRCLFTPYARLIHHESASRGYQKDDPHPVDSALFLQRWQPLLEKGDLFYNANLASYGKMFEPKLK